MRATMSQESQIIRVRQTKAHNDTDPITIYNPDEKVQVLQSLTGAANSASSDGSGSSSLMVFCQRKVRLEEGPHIR